MSHPAVMERQRAEGEGHGDGGEGAVPMELVVDLANVMGSRPDGWWHDRAAAAGRLLAPLGLLAGAEVTGPDARPVRLTRVFAVVEGRARAVPGVPGVELVRAPRDGDEAVVRTCEEVLTAGRRPLAVTADRGLRARLPGGSAVAGPGWLRELLDLRSGA